MSDDKGGFKYDVFISWRDKNIDPSVIERLVVAFQKAGLLAKFFRDTESEPAKEQKLAIEQSRTMLVLLGNAGLTAKTDGDFDKWSYQWKELDQLLQVNSKIAAEFPELPEDEDFERLPADEQQRLVGYQKERLIPCFAVALWYDKDGNPIGDAKQFADHFLPVSPDPSRRIPGGSGLVRKMLKDRFRESRTECYDLSGHAKSKKVDNERSPPWETESINHIKSWFTKHDYQPVGQRLAADARGSDGAARPSTKPTRLIFNPETYIKTAQALWTKPRRLKVDADVRIPIAFRIETTDLGTDHEDAVTFVANSKDSVWVSGEPGAGKSTVLHESALREAQRYLKGESGARCPFLAPLATLCEIAYPEANTDNLGNPDIAELLCQFLLRQKSDLAVTPELLKTFLSETPCTLYFDSVDGVLDEKLRFHITQVIRQSSAAWNDVRFVFSCRTNYSPHDFYGAAISTIELDALTTSQIASFVEKYALAYFPGDGRRQASFKRRFATFQTKLEERRARSFTRSTSPTMRTPLLVAIVCYLLRDDREGDLQVGSAGAEARIMDALFKEIAETGATRSPPFDVIGVMTSLARTTLLSSGSMKFNYHPSRDVAPELNAKGDLDGRPDRDEEEKARFNILRNSSVIMRSDDGTGVFEFVHDRFAEHLVAREMAETATDAEGIAASLQALLPSEGFETAEDRRVELISLLCSHIDRLHGGNPTGVALLAEICRVTIARIDRGDFKRDHGSGQAARAYASAITGLGLLAKHRRDKAQAKAVEDETLACYLRHRGKWKVSERDTITAAMASCEDEASGVTLWSRAATADRGRVTDWLPVPQHDLHAARSAVLVRDYKEFVTAKDRYDDEYWPHRTPDERAFAQERLIPFAQNPRSASLGESSLKDLDGRLVVGDLISAGNNPRGLWSDQTRFPGRPVVNITRAEATAYALWKGAQEKAAIALPSEEDWVAIIIGFGLRDQTYPWGQTLADEFGSPGGNVATSDLEEASTVGVFSPLAPSGLIDFGSNVCCWLASSHRGSDRYIGAHFNSTEREAHITPLRTHPEHPGTRREYVGFWLIKR